MQLGKFIVAAAIGASASQIKTEALVEQLGQIESKEHWEFMLINVQYTDKEYPAYLEGALQYCLDNLPEEAKWCEQNVQTAYSDYGSVLYQENNRIYGEMEYQYALENLEQALKNNLREELRLEQAIVNLPEHDRRLAKFAP